MSSGECNLARVRTAPGATLVTVLRDDQHLVPRAPGARVFVDAHELLARADWRELVNEAVEPLKDRIERFLLPIPAPSAIFCTGHNFRAHIKELGRPVPSHPTLFSKLARALVGPQDNVALPRLSTAVDYEGEVVLVIGSAGRNIPAVRAWEHVAGVTLMNDVSLRDFQNRTSQWLAGKTWEHSTPLGPTIALIGPSRFAELQLETYVNGERRQHGDLADLIFGPAELVADISQITTLTPGDLIATGTPGGVGAAFDPPRFLADRDECEVRVAGVGSLKTKFVVE